MANKKISDLTAAGAAALTDIYETEQGGVSKQETLQQIKDVVTPYKVYRAILNQALNAAPVATELENTVGTVVWSRSSAGVYLATLTGAFPLLKTLLFMQNIQPFSLYVATWASPDAIQVQSYDDFTTAQLNDGVLNNACLEVFVYP